jgi:hypothetical protein
MEVSSGYFPQVNVQWNLGLARRYKTLITTGRTGTEKRKRMFPRGSDRGTGHRGGYVTMSAATSAMKLEDKYAVATFLDAMDGAFRSFYVFRHDRDIFENYYIGEAVSQNNIIIPFAETTVTSVTVNNVSVPFAVTYGIGAGGEDRINFTSGAQSGAVRAYLRGKQRLHVRALNDEVVETFIAEMVKDNHVIQLAFKQV